MPRKILAPHKEQDGYAYIRVQHVAGMGYVTPVSFGVMDVLIYADTEPDSRIISSRRTEEAVETADFLRLCAEEGLVARYYLRADGDRGWAVGLYGTHDTGWYDGDNPFKAGTTLREAYYRYKAVSDASTPSQPLTYATLAEAASTDAPDGATVTVGGREYEVVRSARDVARDAIIVEPVESWQKCKTGDLYALVAGSFAHADTAGSYARAYDGGCAYAHEGGYAYAHEGGYAIAHEGGYAYAHDGGYAYAHDGGTARAYDGGYAIAHEGGYARAYDGGYARAHEGGYAYAHDGGTARAYEGGTAIAYEGGTAIAYEGGTAIAHEGGTAYPYRGDAND